MNRIVHFVTCRPTETCKMQRNETTFGRRKNKNKFLLVLFIYLFAVGQNNFHVAAPCTNGSKSKLELVFGVHNTGRNSMYFRDSRVLVYLSKFF